MNYIHLINDSVLGDLLSKELIIDEKLNIIGTEYDIPIKDNIRKAVSVICNPSQGIEGKLRGKNPCLYSGKLMKGCPDELTYGL